jgi:hypothetical protein
MGGSHGPLRRHHVVCPGRRERRVHRCGAPPGAIDDDGQRAGAGPGKRARRAPVEPHDAAGQPDRDRPRILRALRADPAGAGRSRPRRQRAAADPARSASNLLPPGRRSVCRAGGYRLLGSAPGCFGRFAHRPRDDRPGAGGIRPGHHHVAAARLEADKPASGGRAIYPVLRAGLPGKTSDAALPVRPLTIARVTPTSPSATNGPSSKPAATPWSRACQET